MEIIAKFKPFRLSPITRDIEKYMSSIEEGETAAYEDLTELTGLDCAPGGKGYSYVLSAMKRMERNGICYANIPLFGYRRLNPNETVDDNIRRHQNCRKQIRRTINRNESIDIDRLGMMEKIQHRAISIVGVYANRCLSSRTKRKLIAEIQKHPDRKEIDYESLSEIYLRNKAKAS